MRRTGFTLIELIISVALLIIAISIALFATIGVNGLIQRSDARGVISEAARTIGDEIRRTVNNAPVGGVSPVVPYADSTFAAIQVRDYSAAQAGNTCTVIGRASVSSTSGGEEQYSIDANGTLVAVMIYPVDSAGLCPQLSTTPSYQNRLTSNLSVATDLRFYLQTVACQPISPPACYSKQLLRYTMTLQLAQKISGKATESTRPTLTLRDGLPIGLVNETTATLSIVTTSLAAGTVGTPYMDSIVVSGGVPSYTWSVISGSLPGGLSLSSTTGVISGTPTTAVGSPFSFTARVVDSNGGSATQALSISISNAPSPLQITTLTLPGGTVGTPYSQSVTASGGATPYTWTLNTGTLPAGLNLTSGTPSATLAGTPTTANTYNFTLKVTDSATPTAAIATQAYTVTISAGGTPPTITTASPLTAGTVSCPYSQTVTASGGTTPYTWTLDSGTLPPGLSLTSGTPSATISGTPTTANTYNFTLRVTSPSGTSTKLFSLTINPPGPCGIIIGPGPGPV